LWIAIFGSVVLIGLTLCAIYLVYSKIYHPDLKISASKKLSDFVQDSFASLVQCEQPPNFEIKPTASAGMFCNY
jgi:hypothetical protein